MSTENKVKSDKLLAIVRHAMDLSTNFFNLYKKEGHFFPYIYLHANNIKEIRIDERNRKTVVFILHTTEEMQDHTGHVHPGALITMVDLMSSYACAADERHYSDLDAEPEQSEIVEMMQTMGLSRSLTTIYEAPVPINEDIYIECRVDTDNKKTAVISVDIFDSRGKFLLRGVHDKVKLYKEVKAKI